MLDLCMHGFDILVHPEYKCAIRDSSSEDIPLRNRAGGICIDCANCLWNCLVDYLEGKTIGESMGDRGESCGNHDLCPASLVFCPHGVASSLRRVVYRRCWTGSVFAA